MAEKKFYWLKMKHDFMGRHDIKFLRALHRNVGVTCYVTLLLESITHEGRLRYSDEDAYSIEELAMLCYLPIEEFTPIYEYMLEKKMIKILEDGTLLFPYVAKNLGSETSGAERVRKHRAEKEAKKEALHGNAPVTKCNTEKEKEKEIDIEKELEKEEKDNKSAVSKNLKCIALFQKNISPNMTPLEFEKLNAWLDDMDDNMICLAINIAAENNKRSYAYINSILKRWLNEGIKNEEQYRNSEAIRDKSKTIKPNIKPTGFHNFPNSSTDKYAEAIEMLINEDYRGDK